MRKAQKVTRRAAGILLVILMVFVAVVSISNFEQNQKQNDLASQQSRIRSFFSRADYDFVQLLTTKESTDKNGNPCIVGVIDPELDALLGDLAGAYNADPKTTQPLTEQELRYFLTEGIGETAKKDSDLSVLKAFVLWTATDADLVYNKNIYDDSMNILHREGDAIKNPPENYDYISKQNTLYSDLQYSWI